MSKAKRFLVPVGKEVQTAHEALATAQQKAYEAWIEATDRKNQYFNLLLPAGYKSGYDILDRSTDSLVDGYLVLFGTIEETK